MVVALLPRHGPKARLALAGLMVLCLADAFIGLSLRVAESLQAKAGLVLVKNCYEYQVQRIESGAPRFAPNSTVAGEHQFISFASILENQRPLDNYWVFLSPQVTDAEWDERIALNNYLLDRNRATFEADQREALKLRQGGWGPWTRDASDGERRVINRLAAFDGAVRDPESALNRFWRSVPRLASRRVPTFLPGQAKVDPSPGRTFLANLGTIGVAKSMRLGPELSHWDEKRHQRSPVFPRGIVLGRWRRNFFGLRN